MEKPCVFWGLCVLGILLMLLSKAYFHSSEDLTQPEGLATFRLPANPLYLLSYCRPHGGL